MEHGDWTLTFTKRHDIPDRIYLSASNKISSQPGSDYDTLEVVAEIKKDGSVALEFVEYFHFYDLKFKFAFSKGKFDVDSADGDNPHAATLICKTLRL